MPDSPLYTIRAQAPMRICDIGGWTDTWFAEYGSIFNIAVSPYAQVYINVSPREEYPHPVRLCVVNFGDVYDYDPATSGWEKHPLLEAAIRRIGIPEDVAVEITIHCDAPPGGSTGTSAAVTVALIGALDALTPGRMTPNQVAATAQAVETQDLGLQCGIQDQLCAAHGGINCIEMSHYPLASVAQLQLPSAVLAELESRLALVYLGKSHQSSSVHQKVITQLENDGVDCAPLNELRSLAKSAQIALAAGDFTAFGAAMRANTAAQARLHPDLVSEDARRVIAIAQQHGAAGWKVNGAGGDGGSITLLCEGDATKKQALLREVLQSKQAFQTIAIALDSHGLQVW